LKNDPDRKCFFPANIIGLTDPPNISTFPETLIDTFNFKWQQRTPNPAQVASSYIFTRPDILLGQESSILEVFTHLFIIEELQAF
jgi:hypothetical protein